MNLERLISYTSDLGGVIQFGVWSILGLYSGIMSLFAIKNRRNLHKYTRVYFPKDVDDFINYYVKCINHAKEEILLTSDGFNMSDPHSRERAKKINSALEAFMARGGTVYRYQMLESMHINWILEILRLKRKFPNHYHTFYNRKYEFVGNFCVFDPDRKNGVYEYMLPSPGGSGQATEPRDFGFVHAHRYKLDKAKTKFDEIREDRDTHWITEETGCNLMKQLWDDRIKACGMPDKKVFDEEILNRVRVASFVPAGTKPDLEFNLKDFTGRKEKI